MYTQGLIIDTISDTHNKHDQIMLAGGDVLIHAGDCTSRGSLEEARKFLDWFKDQKYRYKIMIAGNHDWVFEEDPEGMLEECTSRGIVLLNDSGTEIEGIKVWGSPIQPWFFSWAFNRQRGPEINAHWALIPADTEILITHGPAYGILDFVARGENVGCQGLLGQIVGSSVKLHVCGHIHEQRGYNYKHGVTWINASSLSLQYKPVPNPSIRVVRDITGDYIVEAILE